MAGVESLRRDRSKALILQRCVKQGCQLALRWKERGKKMKRERKWKVDLSGGK